ncbi:MAG: hybrid sensor histidine kinase/response regulator [Rhodocyclales bacterium]|nr:hybrid sensor histidine kinase/response regulator [Rhodocyclales bacterium]
MEELKAARARQNHADPAESPPKMHKSVHFQQNAASPKSSFTDLGKAHSCSVECTFPATNPPRQTSMQTLQKNNFSGVIDTPSLTQFVSGVVDYAIYMLSPEGYVNSWNAGAQRFKGYTADEIIGEHFSRFYTEEDKASGLPDRALLTAQTEGKFEDEGWRVRKDSTRFWASVVIDPIRNDDGILVGFAKVTRDITERKLTEQALHASEERFRLLVKGVTDYAIYMLSPEGMVTEWNTGAERIKGFTEREIVGTHFSRFYTEEDRANGLPARALERALADGRLESEGWRVRKDGTHFWAHVVIDAIHNDMGELIGFAKITRDITERRNAALSLERTKEALFQSQKLEAMGKLTGGVAHDFNNLLGVVVTGLELLSREVKTPSATRTIESMQRAAKRGANLTQQLLSFARQQPLQQEKYNLNRVIGSFEAVLRRACNETIRFEIELDPDLRPVLVDATQFEAALLNLVTNAGDAMPRGGTLIVQTRNVQLDHHQVGMLPAGQFVAVTVKDTGTGMSADVLAKATEPFFTTKGPGMGTGLGLSQVHGLVRQSGGDMLLETEVGEGTSISLFLPALVGDNDAAETSSTETNAGNDKALVVDDEPDVLDMAIELFTTMGYDVLSANNSEDALEILLRTPNVDVLFADVLMPGMDGIALGHRARELVPGIKILLASGYPAPAVHATDSPLAAFNFINKPYRLAEIMKMLRKAD